MEEVKKQIAILRDKLEIKNLSVLIGAGFSKNVSNLFLDWNALLYDLVKELYEPQIKESYNLYRGSQKIKSKAISQREFYDNKIKEITNSVGYLEVVSEYIKRKGY
ncbi:MAG TPA: hypothetical protein VFK73_05550, partial [Paludibacter sp.]|nr:hypothetical protein [Paludibacter sp.]